MKFIFSSKNKDEIFYNFLFIIIGLIFIKYFISSFLQIPGDKWAYNELFINYSGGIIRRGLLGSIFLKLNILIGIKPLTFFSIIFSILYSFQLFIYYKLVKKFKNYHFLYIFIIFSPSLVLFNIYDENIFFVRDIFVNLTILLHCFYLFNGKNNFNSNKYNNFLLYLLIPIISLNILNHESQFFFVTIHLLMTSYAYSSNNIKKEDKKYFYYILCLVPLLIILLNGGSWEKVEIINNSIEKFGVRVNDQLAGNINLAIGGFIKWHFFFHGISSFKNLFICLILTLFSFYTIFHYLIKIKVLTLNKFLEKYYLIYFIPSCALFILAVDHGRNINMILTHLICFYLILDTNKSKLNFYYNKLINNFILKNLLILFLFFNIFLWYLPQGGGYSGIGLFDKSSSIFSSTLFNEFIEITKICYNLISTHIIELPEIKL